MEFFELIFLRKSTRQFAERGVDQEKIDRILQAARLAPSAGDLKAYAVVVVRDREARSSLGDAAYGQAFVARAPAVLVFLADGRRSESKYGRRGAELFSVQDATIAAAYAQLAATALGLATCWVGAFDERRVSRILNARERMRPIALLPIGYAVSSPESAG